MNAYKRKDGVLKYDNEKHLAAAKQVIDHFKSAKRPGYYAAVAMYEYASALVEGANKLRNSAEKTEEDTAKIKKNYDEAIKTLEDLLVEIEKGKDVSKYIVTENDAKNIKLLQEPIAYLIPAWAQRNEDIEKAKAGFIKYIETYPKGTNTPKCLLQLGSIYAAQENAAESKKQLDRLKAEFGTSPEAKNALPLLADAFAQMNRKSDTVRAYREMLESNETYSAQIYRLAAQRLFDYEAYTDAIKAADALLKAKETEKVASYKRDGMAIRTRALMMTEKPENIAEARKQVDAYLALVGKTVYAVDVHRLIVELAAYEMKIVAKDAYDERDAIIKRAKDSEKYIANSNIEIDPETRLPKFDDKGLQIMKAIKFDETGKIVSNPPLIVAKTSSDIAALAKAAFESLDSADPQREKWLGSAMNAYAATMRSVDLDKVAAQLHLLQGEDAAANDQKKALKAAQTLTVEKRDAYKAANDAYKKATSALKKAKKGTDEYKKLRTEYSTLKKQNESLKKEYETAKKTYEAQKATIERAAEEAKTYLAKYLEISTIIQDAYLTNLKLMEIRRTMANAAGNDEDRRFYAEEIQATVEKYYEAFGENNSRKAFEKAIRMDDVKEVELGNSSFLKR
jgi:TolA-binding protein